MYNKKYKNEKALDDYEPNLKNYATKKLPIRKLLSPIFVIDTVIEV